MNVCTEKLVECWRQLEGEKKNTCVTIDYSKLQECAIREYNNLFEIPNWRVDKIYPNHNLVFAANCMVFNCLNFAFNIFEKPDTKYCIRKGEFRGALAMASKFYELFGERVIQVSELWKLISATVPLKSFLDGEELIPLPELRDKCLINLMRVLDEDYGGNPLNILEEAMMWDDTGRQNVLRAFNNGRGIVDILTEKFLNAYGDSWTIPDSFEILRFNKKAQLVAVMLYGRSLSSHGTLPPLLDIDEVGPLADYEVPNALRAMDILVYSQDLFAKVNGWQEIEAGSQEEMEIRLSTVAVCVLLLEKINRCRELDGKLPINIAQFDYWLWRKGRESKLRPHLTRTSAY